MHRSSRVNQVRPVGLVAGAMLALCLCVLPAAVNAQGAQPGVAKMSNGGVKAAVETVVRSGEAESADAVGAPNDVAREGKLALLIDTRAGATPFNEPAPTRPTVPSMASKHLAFLHDMPLPEPDGWTAVAATLALALFFFLRRVM